VLLVYILVVAFDQAHALVRLQVLELFELLAEKVEPEGHRSVLVIVIEVLQIFILRLAVLLLLRLSY